MSELTQGRSFKLKKNSAPDKNKIKNSNESIKFLSNKSIDLEENFSKIKNYKSVNSREQYKNLTTEHESQNDFS